VGLGRRTICRPAHGAALRRLCDPNGDHGLGAAFLSRLMKATGEVPDDLGERDRQGGNARRPRDQWERMDTGCRIAVSRASTSRGEAGGHRTDRPRRRRLGKPWESEHGSFPVWRWIQPEGERLDEQALIEQARRSAWDCWRVCAGPIQEAMMAA
jgi:hypothetical protein